jgi:hypothetical protein
VDLTRLAITRDPDIDDPDPLWPSVSTSPTIRCEVAN